jgi:hypothetical protein
MPLTFRDILVSAGFRPSAVGLEGMAKFEITRLEDTSNEVLLNEIRRVAALTPDRRLDIEAFNSQSGTPSR